MKQKSATRLGRAVRAAADRNTQSPMIGKERHSTNNSLRDVILGGQDGLVNMLGIALGVVAAGGLPTFSSSPGLPRQSQSRSQWAPWRIRLSVRIATSI